MPENNKKKPKPKIMPLPNGPYAFIYDPVPAEIELLENSRGEKISNVKAVNLCRCGGSNNKPFCDGTHMKNGFISAKETKGENNIRNNFQGAGITIHDNRGLCAHAAECMGNSPKVFGPTEGVWIDPMGEEAGKIAETIKKCPSGALSYSIEGVENRDRDNDPLVIVSKNGPYWVQGGIELLGEEFGEGASKEHYCLCRCGQSRNKPFCDGSHKPDHGGEPFIDEKN